jgi:hypothetical protein
MFLRPALLAKIARSLVIAAVVAGAPRTAVADPLPRNWPLPPSELQRRFEREPFTITEVESVGAASTGAVKLELRFADGKAIDVKWKAVREDALDHWNNSPRRELAAYRIQQLFLDEHDYVVPTCALRCIPLDAYGPIRTDASPTLENTRCVLGLLSVWLKDVDAPEPFFDRERFARDAPYARGLADLNLLTYLIDHRDGKRTNLLTSTDASDPRSFSVDNGISFESFPWNMEATNWNELHVPWLRKQSVDRLRRVDAARLAELGVVAELAADENGILQLTQPSANTTPHHGVRLKDGWIQLGLTGAGIAEVRKRIEKLLRRVDEGEIAVR